MAKQSKDRATTTTPAAAPSSQAAKEEELPPDLAEAKAKLESKTGKKFRYQKAKKEMPGIPHMLLHGAPEDEGKERTWLDTFVYPAILAVLFFVTFLLFMRFAPMHRAKTFTLPTRRNMGAARSIAHGSAANGNSNMAAESTTQAGGAAAVPEPQKQQQQQQTGEEL